MRLGGLKDKEQPLIGYQQVTEFRITEIEICREIGSQTQVFKEYPSLCFL